MKRPLILDLFCGAGGAAMGYFLAGFDVIGIDHKPQPDYPFRFIQADITTARINWSRFSAVHASPPCQRFSKSRSIKQMSHRHPDLIDFTRGLCKSSKLPYVIENVQGAPLRSPVMLCGSMFRMQWDRFELKRHRLFETNWSVGNVPKHRCGMRTAISVFGHGGMWRENGKDHHAGIAICNQIMGTYWMRNLGGVSQAIPPVYTAFLGRRMLKYGW